MHSYQEWTRVRRGDRGATAVEYGLIIAGVSLACLAGTTVLSNALSASFEATAATLESGGGSGSGGGGGPGGSSERPAATTQVASDVTGTSAVLNGRVIPGGGPTTVTFCIGPTSDLSTCTTVPAVPGSLTGAAETPVSATASGLAPTTTYYFRVSASNGAGAADGQRLSFTTGSGSVGGPVAATRPASSVTVTSATVNGTVTADGDNRALVAFCWGTTASLAADCSNGTLASTGSVPRTAVDEAVSETISGLEPGTDYYVRLVATSQGTDVRSLGGVVSFRTESVVPTVATGGVTSVTATSATVTGTVNAEGARFNTVFCQGTSPLSDTCSNGTRVAAQPATATGTSGTAISLDLTALQPGTTYAVRAGARSPSADTYGPERTFTTTCALAVERDQVGVSPQTVPLLAGITGARLTATPVRTSNAQTGTVALVPGADPQAVVWSGYSGNRTWTGTFTWSSATCPSGTGTLSLKSN